MFRRCLFNQPQLERSRTGGYAPAPPKRCAQVCWPALRSRHCGALVQAEPQPTAERRTFLGETRKSRARPVDQQHPQVAIAAFDAPAASVSPQSSPDAGPNLTKPPSRDHKERLSFSHRCHKGGRGQHANPRDPGQSLGSVLVTHPLCELIVKRFDPLVDAPLLRTHVFNEPPKPRSKTVAFVRQNLLEDAGTTPSPLRYSDATLQH